MERAREGPHRIQAQKGAELAGRDSRRGIMTQSQFSRRDFLKIGAVGAAGAAAAGLAGCA